MEHNGNTLSSLCCVKSVSESRRIDLWRNTSLKATENESSESEDNREPKDAIQATIDKSSKVLAMYKELLKQVNGFALASVFVSVSADFKFNCSQ